MRYKSAAAIVVTSALALATLAGCALQRNEPTRNSEGAIETSQEINPVDLKVGDCTGDLAEGEITESLVVPCTDSHSWEVFAIHTLPDGDYSSAVNETADALCVESFGEFIGLAWDDSIYEMFYIQPTEGSWALGDRDTLCLVGSEAGGLTGTLEGAAS
ncbi:MAG: septum formation family protein [Bifidobacteriaceae bacterium]|jgi:hypothetical protein|nr:septum formation family protein [Bifidobacteriaceae bacterium]